ncbi:MAG: periplasmic heavy metal sensor [Verrucomicrobia bacterium]|nr:periplasmic heavy metal sensor [Verrucomicrobiota bacterium]
MLILALGLLAAAAAYGCIYFVCMSPARSLQQSDKPELAWLKEEFRLSDGEFKRVSELHVAYLPQCRDMCREIDAHNVKLQTLLSGATNVTPEITAALTESARLRSECQTMMLRHFFQVSQTMPPEQGRRYLAWVKEKAFLPNYDMPKE